MNEQPVGLSEIIPLFPLPEVVLLPQQLLPLHVFEPRYCAMLADVLAGDQRIGIALLRSGYEESYFDACTPIEDVIGIGGVVASECLKDGRYNVVLRGMSRARIVGELEGGPYRRARIERIPSSCTCSQHFQGLLRDELRRALDLNFKDQAELQSQCLMLCNAPLPLGELTDLIAGALPLCAQLRQLLLEEPEDAARAQMLLDHVKTTAAMARQASRDAVSEWSFN